MQVCNTLAGQHATEMNTMLQTSTSLRVSVGFTGNKGFMTRSTTGLCNMNKPYRLRKLSQIQGHVLKQPRLCTLESSVCDWVAQHNFKGWRRWVHLLQHHSACTSTKPQISLWSVAVHLLCLRFAFPPLLTGQCIRDLGCCTVLPAIIIAVCTSDNITCSAPAHCTS